MFFRPGWPLSRAGCCCLPVTHLPLQPALNRSNEQTPFASLGVGEVKIQRHNQRCLGPKDHSGSMTTHTTTGRRQVLCIFWPREVPGKTVVIASNEKEALGEWLHLQEMLTWPKGGNKGSSEWV